MHQDSFRSVVCRSLSKTLPSRSKDGSYPETVHCVVPCVVTLQPSVCQGCQDRERSWSQSYREERSMPLQRDYLMAPSLSKHFAEDLLRGAMDLQESLAMLERFQAASQSMRQSNKKRRPEAGEKSPDIDTIIREVLLRPSNAKKVLPRTGSNGLHRQLSNSTDELKNLVKDSLHKKNLLSVSSNNEQASLSQSTRYSPNNCLVSKTTQPKKVPRSFPSCAPVKTDKATPSLVAKLMGLDGLPSQNDHSVMKDEKIKPVSSPRALFDIEMPKSKRLLPQLSGVDSHFDTEMHVSEKLPQEHYSCGMNARSRKVIGSSYDTPVINEIGSMKLIHKEKNMEQVRVKSPKEIKVVSPTSRKQQTKETSEISRRTREKEKSHLTESKNREGKKDLKAKARPASRNAKIIQKPDKKLAASSSSGSMKPILQKAPSNSRQKKMTRRNVNSSTADEIVAYQVQREIVHVLDESDGPSTEHSATPSDESVQSADWDAESSVDDIRNDLSESNESFISTRRGESINSAVDDSQSTAITPRKEAEVKDEISLLLLSDQSFLSRAAEMTGIGAYDHLTNRYKGAAKPEMKNRELYLDTAAEQLERKHGHQHNSLCFTGFWGEKYRATEYLSLEALLTDIGNGIRKLNSYAAADTCGTADSLHMKLERDLRCTDTSINGVWDMGWEDWICMEETECFVRDAGEDILSLLIEEAALDVLT